ncbi:MAG: hypothetical protein K0M64_02500 [Rhizobium sp.]|nr:hypothetical protein [Rhizobium sp.]
MADQVDNALRDFGYRTEKLRLSNTIALNSEKVGVTIDRRFRLNEINSLIRAGDELRKKFGSDILAKLAVAKIRADRDKSFGEFSDAVAESGVGAGKKVVNQRICHVIDSIKNKSELELLRLIYGDALLAIGVFSPLEVRRANLHAARGFSDDDIKSLINTDSGEEFDHGQSVRDTFPRCDFFLRVDSPITGATESTAVAQIVEKVRRLFSLVFRTSVVTPTAEEAAMYASASAARNSACLSRQVGAAVTSASGEVLAVGWNDVPQPGGGLYGKSPLLALPRQAVDERCFSSDGRMCHNDNEKKLIAEKVAAALVDGNLIERARQEDIVRTILGNAAIGGLIEFSRAVHAEMHAILGAARLAGERVVGGKIFITTYPCHVCARHIVAAGITEIYYIEPYRKSLATKLHRDSISEDVGEVGKVRILQFDGVAPRKFIEIFEAGERKKNGLLELPVKTESAPATRVSIKAIPRLEEVVVAEVTEKELNLLQVVQRDRDDGQVA